MKIVNFITDYAVVRKILKHLDLWDISPPKSPQSWLRMTKWSMCHVMTALAVFRLAYSITKFSICKLPDKIVKPPRRDVHEF